MASDWFVQVPFSALVSLQELPERMAVLEKQNLQLRLELEALRALYSETIQLIGDLRRDYAKGKH